MISKSSSFLSCFFFLYKLYCFFFNIFLQFCHMFNFLIHQCGRINMCIYIMAYDFQITGD